MWILLISIDLLSDTDSLQGNKHNKPQLCNLQMLGSVISFFFWCPWKCIKYIISLWYLNGDTYVAVFPKLMMYDHFTKMFFSYIWGNHYAFTLMKKVYDHMICNYLYFNKPLMVHLCSTMKTSKDYGNSILWLKYAQIVTVFNKSHFSWCKLDKKWCICMWRWSWYYIVNCDID